MDDGSGSPRKDGVEHGITPRRLALHLRTRAPGGTPATGEMKMPHRLRTTLIASAMLSLAAVSGCRRDQPAQPQAQTPPATQAPAVQPLADVSEQTPTHVIGISYPPAVNRYPALAAELRKYTDGARAELQQALAGLNGQSPTAPYELVLAFDMLADTPRVVAVKADGSSYTGGAHGNPLIARFTWLPEQNRLLTASELIPNEAAWRDVSDYAREQLHTSLSQRIDEDDGIDASERAQMLRSAGRMIEEGTEPEAANFAQFEPVLGADGRISALRFVFPPYQVGPYSDGTQTVDVPAAVLLPRVAPAYRGLFAGG